MMHAIKTKIWGVPSPVDPQTGLVPIYDASAVKQSTFYKPGRRERRSSSRRWWRRGRRKSARMRSLTRSGRAQRQEALLNKIKREGETVREGDGGDGDRVEEHRREYRRVGGD